MTNISKKIKSIGLKTLNAWKISLGNENFIITPAHNLIYRPDSSNNKFQPSPFIMSVQNYNTNWYCNSNYTNDSGYNLLYDLAWKPISSKEHTIKCSPNIKLNHIIGINYYFYQPYDWAGNKINFNQYSLGSGSGQMYQSPGLKYFESIGMGFRGMSGAIVLDNKTNKFAGLFIRKISNLGTNLRDSTIQTDLTGVSRGFIMPPDIIKKIIYDSGSTKIL